MRVLARSYFVLNSTLKVAVFFKVMIVVFQSPLLLYVKLLLHTPHCYYSIYNWKELMFGWSLLVETSWNVMAEAQKPDFVFRRNGRIHFSRRWRQSSRLLAAEVCASAVVMLDTPCSEVVWRVLATHSISQFTLNFPSRASSCAITFQLESITFAPYFVKLCCVRGRKRCGACLISYVLFFTYERRV